MHLLASAPLTFALYNTAILYRFINVCYASDIPGDLLDVNVFYYFVFQELCIITTKIVRDYSLILNS